MDGWMVEVAWRGVQKSTGVYLAWLQQCQINAAVGMGMGMGMGMGS